MTDDEYVEGASNLQIRTYAKKRDFNPNYQKELEKYNKDRQKYKEEIKEWKKWKVKWDEEEKEEKEERERKQYEALKNKYEK
jgi:hypothetical protein